MPDVSVIQLENTSYNIKDTYARARLMVVLTYGTSTWNDFLTAYNNNCVVYCNVSGRMAFMAWVNNNGTNPTQVEFQYYRSVSSHTNDQQGDQVFIYKLTSSNSWTTTTREASSKMVAGSNLTSDYSNGVLTLSGNYQAFTGATSQNNGSSGLVPAPTSSDSEKFLCGDGTWQTVSSGGGGTVVGITMNGDPISPVNGIIDLGTVLTEHQDITGKQDIQTPVSSPATAGNGIAYIETVSQDENGVITATKSTVRSATGEQSGVVSISNQTFAGNKTFTGVTFITSENEANSVSGGCLRLSGGLGVQKNIYGAKVYNAVWNDYAEFRQADTIEPGRCVTETDSGIMTKTEGRLQAGCRLISDTFGSCMGETDQAKTPIAVAGRVLAYPFKDPSSYHLGDAVCSGPNGTVDAMTREEIREYPERIIGTISEIPKYAVWHAGTKENPIDIYVNGRIWVYVR